VGGVGEEGGGGGGLAGRGPFGKYEILCTRFSSGWIVTELHYMVASHSQNNLDPNEFL